MASIIERTRSRIQAEGHAIETATKAARRNGSGGGVSISSEASGGNNANLFGGGETGKMAQYYQHLRDWVWVCVDAVAGRLSGQPMGLGTISKKSDAGKAALSTTKAAGDSAEQTAARVLAAEKAAKVRILWAKGRIPKFLMSKAADPDNLEVITSHELLDTFQNPNPVQHKAEFLYCLAASLMITGVAYIIKGQREGGGDEYWAAPSTWLEPTHKDGLFSGYKLRVNPMKEPIPIPAEIVGRIYLPDPADLKSVLSPLKAILSAVKIDASIQGSQQDMFEQGIFPNLVLTIGKDITHEGKTGARPVLTGAQYRQIKRAINTRWMESAGNGFPAIVDGLVESITKLSNMPAEMDWLNSGEQVKKRIFQAYGVNPIVTGEVVPGSYAQAYEAERNFCSNAVNPIADSISVCLTDLVNRKAAGAADTTARDGGSQLVLWVEPAVPVDENTWLRKWDIGLKNGAADPEEYRAQVLCLPPREEKPPSSPLLATVGGIQGALSIVTAVGLGQVDQEAAVNMLMVFFGLEQEVAEGMVGDPPEPPEPPMPGGGGVPPSAGSGAADADSDEAGASNGRTKAAGKLAKIPRRALKAAHINQRAGLESEVSRQLASFFERKGGKLLSELGIMGNQT